MAADGCTSPCNTVSHECPCPLAFWSSGASLAPVISMTTLSSVFPNSSLSSVFYSLKDPSVWIPFGSYLDKVLLLVASVLKAKEQAQQQDSVFHARPGSWLDLTVLEVFSNLNNSMTVSHIPGCSPSTLQGVSPVSAHSRPCLAWSGRASHSAPSGRLSCLSLLIRPWAAAGPAGGDVPLGLQLSSMEQDWKTSRCRAEPSPCGDGVMLDRAFAAYRQSSGVGRALLSDSGLSLKLTKDFDFPSFSQPFCLKKWYTPFLQAASRGYHVAWISPSEIKPPFDSSTSLSWILHQLIALGTVPSLNSVPHSIGSSSIPQPTGDLPMADRVTVTAGNRERHQCQSQKPPALLNPVCHKDRHPVDCATCVLLWTPLGKADKEKHSPWPGTYLLTHDKCFLPHCAPQHLDFLPAFKSQLISSFTTPYDFWLSQFLISPCSSLLPKWIVIFHLVC